MEGGVIPWLVGRQEWGLGGKVKGDELEEGIGGRMGQKCEGLNWWDEVRSKMEDGGWSIKKSEIFKRNREKEMVIINQWKRA